MQVHGFDVAALAFDEAGHLRRRAKLDPAYGAPRAVQSSPGCREKPDKRRDKPDFVRKPALPILRSNGFGMAGNAQTGATRGASAPA
jgi:hypothetical protein